MAAATDTDGGGTLKSPGTGKGPSSSQSPLSQRNSGADPSNVNDRNSGYGGKEDLIRDHKRGS